MQVEVNVFLRNENTGRGVGVSWNTSKMTMKLTKGFNFHTKYSEQIVKLFIIHCAVYYNMYDNFHDFEVAYGIGDIS